MLGEKSLTGRSSLFLLGEVGTVLTTLSQLSASYFKRSRGSDKCGAVFRSIDDLPACFCYYLCLKPIWPVAVLWRSTCKPYCADGASLSKAYRHCLKPIFPQKTWSRLLKWNTFLCQQSWYAQLLFREHTHTASRHLFKAPQKWTYATTIRHHVVEAYLCTYTCTCTASSALLQAKILLYRWTWPSSCPSGQHTALQTSKHKRIWCLPFLEFDQLDSSPVRVSPAFRLALDSSGDKSFDLVVAGVRYQRCTMCRQQAGLAVTISVKLG